MTGKPKRHHVLAATFIGGMIGTAARAAIAQAAPAGAGDWPWAILAANLAGALLIGWWSVRLPRSTDIDPRLHPLLVTGLCGGLTTFSALTLATLTLTTAASAAYLAASVTLGLLAVAAGRRAAQAAHRGGLR